jgi:thymidylate synthase (FAD)
VTDIEFRSDVSVSEVQQTGSDSLVVAAARVSTRGLAEDVSEPLSARDAGLIGFLMWNRHASPFEHGSLTVAVEAPIFVAREWMRHRTQSFNEESGRYRELKPVFYSPEITRPMVQVGKPGAYTFEPAEVLASDAELAVAEVARHSWAWYQDLLSYGVAKEVARNVLPLATYTSFYATANLRNWLNFLSLRSAPDALYEIRQAAVEVEHIVQAHWPASYAAWVDNGRGQL